MCNKTKHLITMSRSYFHYLKGSVKVPYHPFKLWIEPTNHCNLRCAMCPNSQKPEDYPQGFMDISLYRDLIRQIENRVSHINLHHRGESLLHPNLTEMISYAKEVGIKTSIHTNATLLNPELSKELICSGLDFLSFSFDGYNKETYENIRIGADFNKTLTNIKEFLSAKSELKSKTPFCVMEFIDFDYPADKLKKLEELAKSIDCRELDQIIIKKVHNWAGSFKASSVKKASSYSKCTFPYYATVIFFDGSVVPCPQDFFGKLSLGNLNSHPLSEIWNSNNTADLRRHFKNRDISNLNPCSTCDIIKRKTFLGIPLSNLSGFLKENLLGFSRSSRKIRYK